MALDALGIMRGSMGYGDDGSGSGTARDALNVMSKFMGCGDDGANGAKCAQRRGGESIGCEDEHG